MYYWITSYANFRANKLFIVTAERIYELVFEHAESEQKMPRRPKRSRNKARELKAKALELIGQHIKTSVIAADLDVPPAQVSQWKRGAQQRSFRFSDDLNKKLNGLVQTQPKHKPKLKLTQFVEKILMSVLTDEGSPYLYDNLAARLKSTKLAGATFVENPGQSALLLDIFSHLDSELRDGVPSYQKSAVFDAILTLWRNPKEFVDNYNQQRTIVKFKYDDELLGEFQEAVASRARTFENVESVIDEGETVFFDVVLRADMAYLPRIFAFGFYLTNQRRSHYAIIPYGVHERFGVLMDSGLWTKIKNENPNDSNLDETNLNEQSQRGVVKNFFTKLIEFADRENRNESAARKKKKIFSQDGFIHEEVLAEIVYRNGERTIADKFVNLSKTFQASREELPETISELLSKGNIVLYDLLYHRSLKDVIGNKVVGFKLPHHLAIPVGIGFTLTALPEMIKSGEWSKLAESVRLFASDESRTSALKNALSEIGVSLRLKLLEESNK